MLNVKSFKLSDDTGVNELLSKYRLAEGASIFVSNGEIMVPYDDGLPMNNSHKAIDMNLQINEMRNQQVVLDHSNKVVDNMTAQMEEQLKEATADYESVTNNKKFEARKKHIEEQIEANASAMRQNDYEIKRLETNIVFYNEALEGLV